MIVRVGPHILNLSQMAHAVFSRDSVVVEFVGGRDVVVYGEDACELAALLLALCSRNTISERDRLEAQQLLHGFPHIQGPEPGWDTEDW
ncbi:hypothetical protein OO015_13665 (plasmid) [Thermomicrobium sp. 4228-Ro]|uniref:hypothetical protein n=1 Tax=Thermomicrobium sp. 4228-Ro TaxID=2993937 RepID=UPI002248B19D|nr:hypothetical protein [Thermomicrobium sp. 4228-Ro]MCX2728532.1 hypothetical protein [Thermomicrobium sp. 4228-Ro]